MNFPVTCSICSVEIRERAIRLNSTNCSSHFVHPRCFGSFERSESVPKICPICHTQAFGVKFAKPFTVWIELDDGRTNSDAMPLPSPVVPLMPPVISAPMVADEVVPCPSTLVQQYLRFPIAPNDRKPFRCQKCGKRYFTQPPMELHYTKCNGLVGGR